MEQFLVYVLFSEVHNKIYVGQTHNLENRLQMHNSPENEGWTRTWQPWRLIYQEELSSRSEALKREKELKSYRGREFIREMLKRRGGDILP